MTDQAPQPGTDVVVAQKVTHPTTGEIIDIVPATDTVTLADVRDAIIAHENDVRDVKRAIDAELTRRLDFEGTRSATVPGFKITTMAPTKTEWDGRVAYTRLRRLVRDGLISKDRADACVRRETVYKPVHGELTKLRAHADQRVRDAVEAARNDVDVDNRRVTVTRQDVRA